MNVTQFEEKYKEKGGVNRLTEMRALMFTQKYIAKHFDVSIERVRQWMIEFFGSVYDPRPDRRTIIIQNMVDFRKNNPQEEFDLAFKKTQYYKEAIEKSNKEIYDTI